MIQPGQDEEGNDPTKPLDSSIDESILLQSQVRAGLITRRRIGVKDLSQMRLARQ